MSAPFPPDIPRTRSAHPERLMGLFAAVAWAAVVFAAFGLLAVLLDRDPIDGEVSPLYGVGALVLGMAAVFAGIVGTASARRPWWGALATAAVTYLVMAGSGIVVGLDLVFRQAQSPFVATAAGLAAVPPVVCWYVITREKLTPPDTGVFSPRNGD